MKTDLISLLLTSLCSLDPCFQGCGRPLFSIDDGLGIQGPGDDRLPLVIELQEMFDMVLNRIQDETEHLYPAVRQVTGDERQVA